MGEAFRLLGDLASEVWSRIGLSLDAAFANMGAGWEGLKAAGLSALEGTIGGVVSFGDRRLYHVVRPGEAVSYPIAIPREQDDWSGAMHASQKKVNPSWTPTPTMIKENPRLPSWVPGGHPMNPMGVRALYLGSSAYRIHGTDAPWTIGQPVSKGCIRLYNKDVVDLYDRVKLGAKVTITWNSYLDGKIKPIPSPYDEVKGKKNSQDRSAAVRSRTSAR